MYQYLILFGFLLLGWGCSPPAPTPVPQPKEITTFDIDTTPPVFEEPETPSITFDPDKYEFIDGFIKVDWQMLSRVIFEDEYINDTLAMVPIFHDEIKILDGRPIQINGYNIPFGDDSGQLHILSAYPNSQCFFCGGAGPESVMDIKTKKVLKNLKTDDVLTFRGTLQLNDNDLNYLNYILNDAILVK